MNLELISFKLCPFVQRSVITLKHKGVPFKITHIDLSNPPDWFHALSPFGKVPVLRVDGEEVVFESAVINEFLDEITAGSLLPIDPLQRAKNRSWIAFGGSCLMDLSGIIHAQSKQAFEEKREVLRTELDWLERTFGDGPYFNGSALSLVDFAYAPFFMRADLMKLCENLYPSAQCPQLARWSEALLALPAVQESVVPDFPNLLRDLIRRKGPYTAAVLGL